MYYITLNILYIISSIYTCIYNISHVLYHTHIIPYQFIISPSLLIPNQTCRTDFHTIRILLQSHPHSSPTDTCFQVKIVNFFFYIYLPITMPGQSHSYMCGQSVHKRCVVKCELSEFALRKLVGIGSL